jgi:chromosome transmission fidelity protein 1
MQDGKDYYENLCMKAVNQCIGRAIRHAKDYACIFLIDSRYEGERIQKKLPKWIRDNGVLNINFGKSLQETSSVPIY